LIWFQFNFWILFGTRFDFGRWFGEATEKDKTMPSTVKSIKPTSGEDLSAQIETLRKDLGELTQTIQGMGAASVKEAASTAKEKVDGIRDTAADQAETARLHAMELQDQAGDFVRNQPATAMGIAAGLGFLVGFLSSRK